MSKPDPFASSLPVLIVGVRNITCDQIDSDWRRCSTDASHKVQVEELYERSGLSYPAEFASLFVLVSRPKLEWIAAYAVPPNTVGCVLWLDPKQIVPDITVAAPDDFVTLARKKDARLAVFDATANIERRLEQLSDVAFQAGGHYYCEARIHRPLSQKDIMASYTPLEFRPFLQL